MISFRHSSSRSAIALVTALAALGLALAASLAAGAGEDATARGPSQACQGADRPAERSTPAQLRRSIRCLVNLERAVRGRSKLARDRSMQKASQKHAVVMVEEQCLAHSCGDEPRLPDRVRRSGYLDGADAWQVAESTGCGVTAQAMVKNWMADTYHRINILEKDFADIGVGVVQEPIKRRCAKDFATFAVIFGWRAPDA